MWLLQEFSPSGCMLYAVWTCAGAADGARHPRAERAGDTHVYSGNPPGRARTQEAGHHKGGARCERAALSHSPLRRELPQPQPGLLLFLALTLHSTCICPFNFSPFSFHSLSTLHFWFELSFECLFYEFIYI